MNESVDRGLQVDTIYIDFEKAFDKVCHTFLIHKLQALNIEDSWISWVFSYLSDRQFYVKIKQFFSTPKLMTSRVPQGSDIGPLLFLLFINDLPQCILHSQLLMLAEDCKLAYALDKVSDVVDLQSDMTLTVSFNGLSQITYH